MNSSLFSLFFQLALSSLQKTYDQTARDLYETQLLNAQLETEADDDEDDQMLKDRFVELLSRLNGESACAQLVFVQVPAFATRK